MRLVLTMCFLALGLLGCDSDSSSGDGGSSGASGGGASGGGASGGGASGGGASGGGTSGGGASGGGGGDSCNVIAPTACPSDMPTYDDVQPIIEQRCVVCHSGGGSELCPTCWPLNTYGHVADWSDDVRAAMLSCSMPPPGSGVTMTDAERMKILEWIRCEL